MHGKKPIGQFTSAMAAPWLFVFVFSYNYISLPTSSFIDSSALWPWIASKMAEVKQQASMIIEQESKETDTCAMMATPFTNAHALDKNCLKRGQSSNQAALDYVPDQPKIPLDDDSVREFLEQELSTPTLEQMYPYLWLLLTMDSSNVDALHGQIVKGREIVITEDPGLHLVWYRDRIFVKPIPPALLNHDFWGQYLSAQTSSSSRKSALGFLRSYAYLIKYRSDLRIAIESGLLPAETTWSSWSLFINPFTSLSDTEVSLRYHFGTFRLSRLNIASQLLGVKRKNDSKGRTRDYHVIHRDTVSNLREFAAPLLFTFASVSSILSAMQVLLSLPPDSRSHGWVFSGMQAAITFWAFSIVVLVGLAICWVLILGFLLAYGLLQPFLGWQVRNRCLNRLKGSEHGRC